jgi:hypothetical protein
VCFLVALDNADFGLQTWPELVQLSLNIRILHRCAKGAVKCIGTSCSVLLASFLLINTCVSKWRAPLLLLCLLRVPKEMFVILKLSTSPKHVKTNHENWKSKHFFCCIAKFSLKKQKTNWKLRKSWVFQLYHLWKDLILLYLRSWNFFFPNYFS